jgi:protein O-GlcNAc transferase
MSRHESTLRQVQTLIAAGKAEQARSALVRTLQKDPAEPWLNNAMAVTWIIQGQHQQAHYYAERASRAMPHNPEFQSTLASALVGLDRREEAVALLEAVIARYPSHANTRLSLANALAALDQHARAISHCREGLHHAPADRELRIALAQALMNTGEVEEAVAIGREVLSSAAQTPEKAVWLPYAMNYITSITPREHFDAHRAIEPVFAAAAGRARPAPAPAEPHKKLRVGLVSPDLRTHSVAFFIEPLMESADKSLVEFICYSTTAKEDRVTDRLRPHAALWRHVHAKASREIAEQIRRDKIDILIDLAGLTNGERLAIFAEKPAPIQMTYLGYPNTTGLRAIDHRIVDSHTDPEGSDAFAAETLLRLDPCFLCYKPPTAAPLPASEPPSAANGFITFGSFNTLIKLSDATVDLWSELLKQTDGARLVLKARQLRDPATRDSTIARFVRRGVEAARIELIPATAGLEEHLALYSRLDVGLDPIPYAGTTTTCEAMWMGVPVVTLAGQTHASRVGASLLRSVKLDDLVTSDPASFIAAARSLGTDTARLRALRASGPTGLRSTMQGSALCDAPGFARRFTDALRAVWIERCTVSQSP